MEISLTKILEKQKKEQIYGRANRRRPIFDSTIQLVVVNVYTKFEASILNGCGDIFDEKSRKKEKGKEEQIGECLFAISQYILLLQTSIPNVKFLSETVVEISLTKNLRERKKNKHREEHKEKTHFQSHNTTCRCEPVYQI